MIYRVRLAWSVYENIIYRFSYGEYLTHRLKTNIYAKPAAKFFDEGLVNIQGKLNDKLYKVLYHIYPFSSKIDNLKTYSLSYWHMLCDANYEIYEDYNKVNRYCTIEYRCSNGTFDEIVWQNYINFFVKMMVYCKSEYFDEEILNRRKEKLGNIFNNIEEYSKIYLEQVLEFYDMIFDNNLDKIYFLRQYLKSFEVSQISFSKAKKFTINSG